MAVIFAVFAGCFAVVQAGLNRLVSQSWGFSSALLLNGLVFLTFNLILFSLVWLQPKLFPSDFLIQGRLTDFKFWWILPGLCGFMLVSGLVLSINRVGALQTFVFCIAAQIVCGLLWDYFMEGRAFTTSRVLGASITMVGALISSYPSSNH